MKKDYENALKDARKSTSFNPIYAKGYHREGKCHMNLGSSSVAKKCFQKALEIDPQNRQAEADVSQHLLCSLCS